MLSSIFLIYKNLKTSISGCHCEDQVRELSKLKCDRVCVISLYSKERGVCVCVCTVANMSSLGEKHFKVTHYIVLDPEHVNVQGVNNPISQLGAEMSTPQLVWLEVSFDKRIAFRYFKLMSLVGSAKGQQIQFARSLEKRTVMKVTTKPACLGANTHLRLRTGG